MFLVFAQSFFPTLIMIPLAYLVFSFDWALLLWQVGVICTVVVGSVGDKILTISAVRRALARKCIAGRVHLVKLRTYILPLPGNL